MKLDEGIQHTVELKDDKPVAARNYRLSPEQSEHIEEWVKEMYAAGFIQPSTSAYSSPIIVIKKPIGWRIVHDYRAVNAQTIIPPSLIPRREEIVDSMAGSQYFTSMDLRSGYYQIPLRESDRPITAFSTKTGHWEYTVLAQGLCGGPATFNRVMQEIFKDLQDI